MTSLPEKERDKLFGSSQERVQPFRPLDRNELSEHALLLLDRYRVKDANDPMAIFVSIVDKMSAHQREVISRFEAAIALAGVEFGRIDLAIGKAEETQRHVEALVIALDQTQKDFAVTTNKIRQRSNFDIILNHLQPCIYGLFGAILALLVIFISLHQKIL
ncbi:MAG TPA: hypothetical protein VK775_18015 [Chthoniobacterales bacterium]|jgi:hypothetical protein|nr:hypothetical protein [Chthoniobacterales bacterium]